jgi:aerobic carbon-monoxide dehydrogenase medium subunit
MPSTCIWGAWRENEKGWEMKFAPVRYVRPATLADALQYLSQPGAVPLAGGQSLLASLAFRLSAPAVLIDLGRLAELKAITVTGGRLRIGACTTHAELGRNELVRRHAPLFAQATHLIAHPAIRNRGTIGGSLAYADPAAELPACAVALDADLVLVSTGGKRHVPAVEFFTGLLSTALTEGEVIAAIDVPVPSQGESFTIVELARRSGDYAMAGVAIQVRFTGRAVAAARIVPFGVGVRPVIAVRASAALVGHAIDDGSIAAAQAVLDADLDPSPDQHGGPDMKRHLARVVLGRGLRQLSLSRGAP